MTSEADQVERLQQRLERERRARREAEIIAERGMRELWLANSELRERVTSRTAELERTISALGHRHRALVTVAQRELAAVRQAVDPRADASPSDGQTGPLRSLERVTELLAECPPTEDRPASTTCDPVRFTDELIDRWQRPAARTGQLLGIELASESIPTELDWSAVQAVTDVLLQTTIRHSKPGALRLLLRVMSDGASMVFTDFRPELDAVALAEALETRSAWSGLGPVENDLGVAQLIVESVGGRFEIETRNGGTQVSVFVPAVPGSPAS